MDNYRPQGGGGSAYRGKGLGRSPPRTRKAGGTHPTGMPSWVDYVLISGNINCKA